MIAPEAYRAVLTVALMFVFLPALLLLGERPGTAGFVMTVATLAVGVAFTLIAVVAIKFSANRTPRESEHEELP
ncbi:MAG TPA: hypothetical protein VHC49_15805 [Mycobacteriales bacterium]|nr:hypothetical protein [Mycobacteriales bacterium]